MKFFGDISADDITNISSVLQSRTSLAPPLNLKIEKIGVFPDARRPQVLWCGVSGDGESLSALHKQLDSDFEGIGFKRENRPFRAHLTLGRIKESHGLTVISEALTKHDGFTDGKFDCKELILFQSKLLPQGAVYTKLAEFKLKG